MQLLLLGWGGGGLWMWHGNCHGTRDVMFVLVNVVFILVDVVWCYSCLVWCLL